MRRLMIVLGLGVILLIAAIACEESDSGQQREDSIETRTEQFAKAEALYPVPKQENFPLRAELVKFTERQDLINHPTYVYILADTGQIVGYYVAKTFPISICAFLSSTEDVRTSNNGNLILTAPSLDGIYYGGAGSSSACNGWFFFDQATDALIEIIGVNIFVSDQPLQVDVEPFKVEVVTE